MAQAGEAVLTPILQNWTQILWSLTHIMREDPTRRFAIGFTIEKCDLRIWFASRSDVLVSTPINFLTVRDTFESRPTYTNAVLTQRLLLQDIERVVDFFSRLQFADDQDLGFDKTITRAPGLDATGRAQYDIKVGEKVYRTQRLISSIGAESTRGRGTRVWEVRELDAHGNEASESCILKDSWSDRSRDREGKINELIRGTKTADQRVTEGLNKSLLTYLSSWDVTVEISKGVHHTDSTRGIITRGQAPVFTNTLQVMKDFEARQPVPQKNPAQGTASQVQAKTAHVVYGEKIHHRVVFEEVGITTADVGSLSQAFHHLSQVSNGMSITSPTVNDVAHHTAVQDCMPSIWPVGCIAMLAPGTSSFTRATQSWETSSTPRKRTIIRDTTCVRYVCIIPRFCLHPTINYFVGHRVLYGRGGGLL